LEEEAPAEEEQPDIDAQTSETPPPKKKKEKATKNGDTVQVEESPAKDASEENSNGSTKASGGKPFRRVAVDTEVHPEFSDNSYYAKGGDLYGQKANEDLGQVHGKDFRAAKTKKKKGSYKGGPIERGVKSIKFSYDEDE